MEQLFAVYPHGTIAFFHKVIVFGFLSGVCLFVPLAWSVADSWSSQLFCDRVLRGYHLLRMGIFVLQLPVRAYVMWRLRAARGHAAREGVVASLVGITRSRFWALNQSTGVCAYMLFAFALVFAVAGRHCATPSPALFRFLLASLAVFTLHMACSFVWLRQVMAEDMFEAAMWKRGLLRAQVDALTKVVRYPHIQQVDVGSDVSASPSPDASPSSVGASSPNASPSPSPFKVSSSPEVSPDPIVVEVDGVHLSGNECHICFNEYAGGDEVRILRCAHHYHLACVDAWLSNRKSCPLCLAEIDAPAVSNGFTKMLLAGALPPVPRAGDAANNRVMRAVLTEQAGAGAAPEPEPQPQPEPEHAAAPSGSAAEQLAGLRTRRGTAAAAPVVYSTESGLRTSPPAAPAAASSSAATGEESKEAPRADDSAAAAAPALASPPAPASTAAPASDASAAPASQPSAAASPSGATSASSAPHSAASASALPSNPGVKQVSRLGARPAAPTVPAAAAAPVLPASRAPYAAARLAATASWRQELEAWGEAKDDEDMAPAAAATASADDRALDELMRKWQLEEQSLANEPPADGDEEDA